MILSKLQITWAFKIFFCPSSFQVGQDTLSFVAAMAPQTENINLLAAIRCGEIHPPMLARTIATLDHMLEGRLTAKYHLFRPSRETLPSEVDTVRSREVIKILKQAFDEEKIDFKGEHYDLELKTTDPTKPYQKGGPLFYFGVTHQQRRNYVLNFVMSI